MDLRNLPSDLDAFGRVTARRSLIEKEFGTDLSALSIDSTKLGHAEEKNCENMFGAVPIPVGLAGPLTITLSDGTKTTVYLPLATTEGALVASVNRGCKALSTCDVRTSSIYHGVTRSIAFRIPNSEFRIRNWIQEHEKEWKAVGEATSSHLKILSYDIDEKDNHIFLTIAADTDEAMGMNMVTIAAQAIGAYIADATGAQFITVAANLDSDKKPSKRTHDRGRGYEASATCNLQPETITEVLKTTPEALLATAKVKLELGSSIAGAIGHNCHAANIIAALYLATGQDAAHVVEGSLADTTVEMQNSECGIRNVKISVRLPALLLGIRGGGSTLPAQKKCLQLLLGHNSEFRIPNSELHPCRQLAEIFAASVLAGELSLLAAQSSHTLAKAHKSLGR
ncbi:hypothetical protein A2881_00435 [Candidatus Peribacteria bacterium RIFCSPHIGHO2_01_FULL_55_13]|nr:MAG: hypothetical protein A2881_00435 [Candidatus Peribacteria bacterium RIFCSPHIGHO2_01_FULL_55_13]